MEPYRMTVTLDAAGVDCFGRLKPSRILYYMQIAGEAHCRDLALDWDTMSARHMFWAVTRHYVRVYRLPSLGETLTLETWPGVTTRVAYPRSVVCLDAAGNVCFQSMTLWVLMDTDTRSMILPGKSGITVPGLVRGNELAAPGALMPTRGGQARRRYVCYSDLDRNGHMNNCRYLDWVDDLLPAAFHGAHPVAEFTVCYHSEAREGEEMRMVYTMADGVLLADGCRNVDGQLHRVFSAKVRFQE